MLLAQLETAVGKASELVDRASVASDRWLFLAALGFILVGGTLIIRWLVASLEMKDRVHDESIERARIAHANERNEWRQQQLEAKLGFLEALKQQRSDFREELALERNATGRMAETVQKLAYQLSIEVPKQ